MKKILLILLVTASSPLLAQKWGLEYGLGYVYAKPLGGMGHVIDRGHGANLNFGLVNPGKRFAFGIDFSYAQYGREKSKQEYTLDDGTKAPMEIIVSNAFTTLTVYTRLYLTTSGIVRPYIAGKVGYSLFDTQLSVYDPDDNDHCEPVNNEVLHDDGSMVAAIGAGAKVDMGSVFKKLPAGMLYMESSVNFMQGGQVRYMNVNADSHHHSAPPDTDDVMTQFINTQTQVVHDHHVGYLYTNPVQMLELKFGLSMYFSR